MHVHPGMYDLYLTLHQTFSIARILLQVTEARTHAEAVACAAREFAEAEARARAVAQVKAEAEAKTAAEAHVNAKVRLSPHNPQHRSTVPFDQMEKKYRNLVNELPRAADAAWDSGCEGGPVLCLQGTREQVLTDLKDWVTNIDPNTPRVFWLNGMAGIGKSTIAQTIAEFANDRNILGGSFFFSRNNDDLRNSKLVFTTLAYHLAFFHGRIFMPLIGKALEEEAKSATSNIHTQFRNLILKPLQENKPGNITLCPVLLVLDALDECDPEERTQDILRLILNNIDKFLFTLRIFLTSRPEPYIHSVFNNSMNHSSFVLHNVDDTVIQGDIRQYLKFHLSPSYIKQAIPSDWPTSNKINQLLDLSGKLFIFAATTVQFVCGPMVADPLAMLEIVLGSWGTDGSKPYAQLDELYLQVLRNAVSTSGKRHMMLTSSFSDFRVLFWLQKVQEAHESQKSSKSSKSIFRQVHFLKHAKAHQSTIWSYQKKLY